AILCSSNSRAAPFELAERGQDVADVRQEGPVGPDHNHPAPPYLLPVRVQQVRDAVQPDGGLPGAGRALHADRLRGIGPDDIVLVGLDGCHDVPHGPRPRPKKRGASGMSLRASARWYRSALRYSSETGSPPRALRDKTSSRISRRNSRERLS